MIMSEGHTEEIKSALLENVNRGMTVFPVSGGYTGQGKESNYDNNGKSGIPYSYECY